MAQMKQHSALAIELLRKTETATMDVVLAILQHHERMDGSGYPKQGAVTRSILMPASWQSPICTMR